LPPVSPPRLLDGLRLRAGVCAYPARTVEGVEVRRSRAKYPKVIKRVGKSPPQYVDWDMEDE